MVPPDEAVDDRPVVLIVEDERELADLYASFIDDACRVRVAYDGDQAVEAIDQDLDVAFLDRRLDAWSGDELVNVIRERGIDCGIVMVTAVTPDVDIVDLPVDDYLTKPIFAEDLRAAVEETLFRLVGGADKREYLGLLSRKLALEEELPADRLENTVEYRKLDRRLALAEERLDLAAIPATSKHRPEACPECGLRWDVRVEGTVGYIPLGSRVWKCRQCGNVENLPDPTDRRVARR